MTVRRIVAALAAVALVGCSGSDGDPDLVPDTTTTTLVSDDELIDGAFEENDGEREPGDAPVSTDESIPTESTAASTKPPSDGDSEATDGSTGSDSNDATATAGSATTGGGSTTTGGATSGGAATTGGTATGGAATTGSQTDGGSATDGSTASTGGTDGSSGAVGSTGEIEALTGVVTVGDDRYAFPIDACNVTDEETSVEGGASRNGVPFEVRVTSSVIDLDDDGADETTFEVKLLSNPGEAAGTQPALKAVGVQSTTIGAAYEVDFSVSTDRITASGQIIDDNGVAIPSGETRPMTLDIRCA